MYVLSCKASALWIYIPEPLSILSSLKEIIDEMDKQYDSIARALARFRSQPNPSAKLLVGIIVFVKKQWGNTWSFSGRLIGQLVDFESPYMAIS